MNSSLVSAVFANILITSILSTGMLQIVPVIFSIRPQGMVATFLNDMILSLCMLSNSFGKLYTSSLFDTA